jgi:nucleoside-diphosphate-sugar epimerase
MNKKISKHILLGAGGAVGNSLTRILLKNSESIRLVSRSGYSIEGTESFISDITNLRETLSAVEESSIVYLLAGLPYNQWYEQWPNIMNNVVKVCEAKKARLIFFDNVYMYGRVEGKMTEETPANPCSSKGELRAKISESLLSEMKKNRITAIIARAADIYGPYATNNSIPYIFVFDRLLKGKKPQWLVNAKVKHSYTYTGDCAEALYILSKSEEAYNQVWHLPTASPAITGEEFIKIAAKEFGKDRSYNILSKLIIRLAGLFNSQVRETYEMLYQSEFDYVFNSSKFEKYFNYKPVSYSEGIKDTLTFIKENLKTQD